MTQDPLTASPFDVVDVREERRAKHNEWLDRQSVKKAANDEAAKLALNPAVEKVDESNPVDGFFGGQQEISPFDVSEQQPTYSRASADGEDDGGSPFGAEALANVLGDVRKGDTSGINNAALRAVSTPFVKAGQGALAGLEWSGNVGQTAAMHVTYNAQRYVPGRQELEGLVTEKMRGGKSYGKAVNEAWEETNLELLTIPFFTTALTPNGSITLDAQDIIATGFDPIELALTFGTGGLGSGGGVLRGAVKEAVGQSVGVKGGRRIGRASKTAAKGAKQFAGDPKAARAAIESYVKGTTAHGARQVQRVVANVAPHDTLSVQAFPTGDLTRAEKLSQTPYAGAVARKIIGITNPNALGRQGNAGTRAMGVYERAGAIGGNAVEAAVAWAEGVVGDSVGRLKQTLGMAPTGARRTFGVDRRGIVNAERIKLTDRGVSEYKQRGLETREIGFGDLIENYQAGARKGQTGYQSWFTGLTEADQEILERHVRAHNEMLNMLVAEGIADSAKAATELIGDPSQTYRWIHRVAHSETMIDETGEQVLLDFRGSSTTATSNYKKSRAYELQIEGIENGVSYTDPAEALESWLSAGYRMISEKRAAEVLKAEGVMITKREIMARFHPAVVQAVVNAEKGLAAARARLGRTKQSKADRRSKVAPSKDAVSKLDADARVVERRRDKLVRDLEESAAKIAHHAKMSKEAGNDGARRSAKAAMRKQQGASREISKLIHGIDVDYKNQLDRAVSAQGKLEGIQSEGIGLATTAAEAEKHVTLMQMALHRAKKQYSDIVEKSIDNASTMDAQLFGGTKGRKTRVELYKSGPFANHIIKKDVAEVLTDRFGDKGKKILSQIETVTGTARTLSTGTADLGWLTIQGALLAAMHPAIYAKSAVKSLEAVLNPNARLKYVNDNMMDIIEGIESGLDFGSSEFFMALERGGGLTRVADKLQNRFGEEGGMHKAIQRWRENVQPIGRLGTGFNTFLDIAKIELWKSMKPMRAGTDSVADVQLRATLAAHVNNVMGTLNTKFLGVSPTQRQLEGALILFSPRYTRSAFALMGQLMKGPGRAGTLDGLASREAARAIGGMVAAGTLAMWAFGQATGQQPGLDPRKPGWLTIDFAGQNIGIGGSTRALLDTMFKSTAAMSGMDGRDPSDLVDFNIFNARSRQTNPLTQFWLNRTAPGVRELLTRETFSGEKLDSPFEFVRKGVLPKFAPFAAQNFIQPGPGETPGVGTLLPETVGLRARPLGAYEKLQIERDKAAKEIHGRPWDSTPDQRGLDLDEKALIEANNPDLKRLKELSRVNSDPTLKLYFDKIEDDRTFLQDAVGLAATEFLSTDQLNGRTFRGKYDDAVRQAFNNRQRREDPEGEYADAIDRLKELDERDADAVTEFDRLFDEYITTVRENPIAKDAFGNPNFREMKRAEEAFEKRVGPETYNRIRNHYRGLDPEGNPRELTYEGEEIAVQLRRDRDLLNEVGYWSAADDLIGDDQDLYRVWQRFEGTDSPAVKEAMKQRYPALIRIEATVERKRQRLRRSRADVDTALIKWYGFRAMNAETRAMERALQNQVRQRGTAN